MGVVYFFLLMHLQIQLPINADRYGRMKISADVSGYARFLNTHTDSAADTTDARYVSIRSIRNGSVNASAEPGTKDSSPNFEKFQNSGAYDKKP